MEKLLVKSEYFMNLPEMFKVEPGISIMAGPCAIESIEQMEEVAKNLLSNNVRFIRGMAFKPRTSPYDFQGLGLEGLKILNYIRKKYNLLAISEIMDPRDVELGIKYLDIIQIGSRNMQNYSLLKEVGKTNHPVMLKRGMTSTIMEFLLAAKYIASQGNKKLLLCERGIRTFESYTRNTLDITCIAVIKQQTTLPVIVDVSHSLGRTDLIEPMMKYLYNMNIDGIMVEVHPEPALSLCDAEQALSCIEFTRILKSIRNDYRGTN